MLSSETDHPARERLYEPRAEVQPSIEAVRRAFRDADGLTLLRLLRELAPSCQYSGRELARLLGVSNRHLQRLFATRIQLRPERLLKEERLLSARQLLRTASSVKEVAFTLGFRQASQFSRDYRHRFGVRPSAVRNEATYPAHSPSDSAHSARKALARATSTVSSPSLNQP
jgi:transcriptional regulator GlxA family with amidase domain